MLDVTHTHLFTFRFHQGAAHQSGCKILEIREIPEPFPAALGNSFVARALLRLNRALIRRKQRTVLLSNLQSRASDLPTVDDLLQETIPVSDALKAELLESAA